ncbi:MAG: PAS domain-containing protein [Bacteroidetes bacterium]|nr:PAS domain-containing protein [Bacteroidota bacterium]
MEDAVINNPKEGLEGKLIFKHFPNYAKHIRDNYIIPYIREQLTLARQVNMPLLNFFQSMSEEEIISMSIPSHTEFLTAVEENRIDEQIEKSLKLWVDDQMGIVGRYDIKAEDLTLGSYIRKRALSKFITTYTYNPEEIIELFNEIDTYSTKSNTAAANTYIRLLKDKINDQLYMIEKISNTTPGLNYVFSLENSRFIFINKNYEQFLGHTFDELQELGAGILAGIIHPDDLAHTSSILATFNTVNDGNVISWDLRIKNLKGEYIWMRNYTAVFRRNSQGEPVEIIGIMLDINAQKNTAEQLIYQEEQLLEAQEQANMASYEWDIETNELTVTPHFLKIFELEEGFKRDEIVKFINPEDIGTINETRKNAIDTNSSFNTVYRYTRNGKEKKIWSKGIAGEKNGKKVVRGTVMDVTERENMIEQLQDSERSLFQKNNELQQSNASLEEYAYVASHDLKEPLRKISTFGDRLYMSQHNRLTADGQVYLQKIIDSSRRMQVMISDLLSVSTITGNKNYEPVNLADILAEALQSIEHKIEEKNALVTYSDLPTVHVVPSQFRQLFQNLINNSLKFSQENIQPQITVTHKYVSYGEVAGYGIVQAKRYLQLTFTDNGIGFDNIYANKIFTIFQRLHGKQEYEGTGIGLAICKKIVENHSGTIYATGALNKGATFTIIIPL